MNATIFVIREHESIEYHFAVEVSLDVDGHVEALVGEDVPERYWSTRYGGLEIEETGYLKYSHGEDIELEPEEDEEAQQAIADLKKAWADERARLKAIFAPDRRADLD
jgi:hypothetical protein